jgi:ribosomal protein S1
MNITICAATVVQHSKKKQTLQLLVENHALPLSLSTKQLPTAAYFIAGDQIDVEARETNDGLELVRLLQKHGNLHYDALVRAHAEKQRIKAYVYAQNSGGYELSFKGYRCFMPFSESTYKGDPFAIANDLIGQVIEVNIAEINQNQVILTRVALEKLNQRNKKTAELQMLFPGYVFNGSIQQISDFGLFIGFKATTGLLHITDLLGITPDQAKKVKTEFYLLAKLVFTIDRQLEVRVKEVKAPKYSLSWDPLNDTNKVFHEMLHHLIATDERFIKIRAMMP